MIHRGQLVPVVIAFLLTITYRWLNKLSLTRCGLWKAPSRREPQESPSRGLDEATAKSSEPFLEELVSATNRLLAKVDERSRAVLALRILAVDDMPTLQELGSRFSLTRERIRKSKSRSKRKFASESGSAKNKAFYGASSRMREQLGQVIPRNDLKNLKRAFNASKSTRDAQCCCPCFSGRRGRTSGTRILS